MRIITLAATAIIVLATSSVYAADELATLNGVKATPMASSELDAVKGLHIHFFVNGNFHEIGEPPTSLHPNGEGGGFAAPGYNGLCAAQAATVVISGLGSSNLGTC